MATSAELLALFHLNPVDATTPYRWTDAQIYSWLSEGQREAAIRGLLIRDVDTVSVCRVSVTSGTSVYAISPLIIRVDAAFLVDSDGNRSSIGIYDRKELDRIYPNWRTEEDTPTGFAIEGNTLTLDRVPIADATLYLEVHRLPLAVISASSQPEIPAIHHDELVNWALYRAHLTEDDDEERPVGRWKKYLDQFERYFGRKPNADLKRKQATNTPHRVKAWW